MSQFLISHVGIAVKDLNPAIERYRLLTGQQDPVIEEVPDQKVTVAIFAGSDKDAAGCGRIELLAATSPDSPIAGFLAKRGEGLHHVCIYVENLDKKIADLKAAGIRMIDETPRPGASGQRVAFVHPADARGVLIELEELPP